MVETRVVGTQVVETWVVEVQGVSSLAITPRTKSVLATHLVHRQPRSRRLPRPFESLRNSKRRASPQSRYFVTKPHGREP